MQVFAANVHKLRKGRMSEQYLEAIEVSTGEAPRLGIIWLHGLGADGHDFEPIVPELRLPFAARFVFPHAPERSITINNGMRMRAWFDILTVSRNGAEDEPAIRDSAARVQRLIDREIERGLRAEQIVLAGFSQGGALALHLGLRETRPLAGIMALSAFLPLAATLADERSDANADVPIFWGHGAADPIIELAFAERSLGHLRANDYEVQFETYPMAHSVCPEEITAIGAWLRDLAAPAA